MRIAKGRILFVAVVGASLPLACGKADSGDTKEDAPTPTYTAVEGEEATQFLEGAARTDSIDEAGLGALVTMGVNENAEDATEGVDELDDSAVGLLLASQTAKDTFDPSGFISPADTTFGTPAIEGDDGFGLVPAGFGPEVPSTHDPLKDKIDWSKKASVKAKTEFQISGVGKVSVKNQGQRGTCAAHTGASALEYKILKMYPDHLKSIDLSEQRFYMIAKKELWAKGGGKTNVDAGSSWGAAFQTSNGFYGETSPATDTVAKKSVGYNIPLEADCPYHDKPGTNELQLPQLTSCQKGAVFVTKTSTTYYYSEGGGAAKWYSDSLRTAQDIFNYLVDKDLPVAISANITKNWEKNTGVIKLKGETNQVLGGHAFLVVGMRKLDEKKYPGEGGSCFIIKNSWGTGWGTNGYACMTLAWFNKYRHSGFFDVAHDIKVNLSYIKERQKKGTAAKTNEAAKPAVVKVPKAANNAFGLVDEGDDATAGVPSLAEETPEVTADGFTMAGLVTPRGDVVRGMYKIEGATISIKGVLAGEAGETQVLSLPYESTGENAGTIKVPVEGGFAFAGGELKDGDIRLCSGRYAADCQFNMVAGENRLVVGMTEAALANVQADPNAVYISLLTLGDYGVEYSPAGDTAVDIRLVKAGAPTTPIRMALNTSDGVISARGRPIGNLKELSLCSGTYRSACRLVVNSTNSDLHVFFK